MFRKAEKYKKVIDRCYPKDPAEGVVKSQVGKFLAYAIEMPHQLAKLGEHLELHISKELRVKGPVAGTFLPISVYMTSELVGAAPTNLNLFAEHVLACIKLLVKDPRADVQELGATLLAKFAANRLEASHHDLEGMFLPTVLAFVRDGPRVPGLAALNAILSSVPDFEQFVKRQLSSEKSELVVVLLKSAAAAPPAAAPAAAAAASAEAAEVVVPVVEPVDEVTDLTFKCFATLGNRSGNNTVRSILLLLLAALAPLRASHATLADNIVATYVGAIPPQHDHVAVAVLLQSFGKETPAKDKLQTVKLLTRVVRSSIGPVVEVIHKLIDELLEPTVPGDLNDVTLLQNELMTCMTTVVERVVDIPQKLEAVQYVAERLNDSEALSSEQLQLLCKCLLVLTQTVVSSLDGRVPNSLLSCLLSLNDHADASVRLAALQVIFSLLRHVLTLAPTTEATRNFANFTAGSLLGGGNNMSLHVSLVQHALHKTNKKENYIVLSEVLNLLFDTNGPSEVLLSLPFAFALLQSFDESASKSDEPGKRDKDNKREKKEAGVVLMQKVLMVWILAASEHIVKKASPDWAGANIAPLISAANVLAASVALQIESGAPLMPLSKKTSIKNITDPTFPHTDRAGIAASFATILSKLLEREILATSLSDPIDISFRFESTSYWSQLPKATKALKLSRSLAEETAAAASAAAPAPSPAAAAVATAPAVQPSKLRKTLSESQALPSPVKTSDYARVLQLQTKQDADLKADLAVLSALLSQPATPFATSSSNLYPATLLETR